MKRFNLLAALMVLGLLSTCNLDTRYFTDYEGLNLIENLPFDGVWPAGTLLAGQPYWQTTTDIDPTTVVNDPYMNWEEILSVVGPSDAPAGSKVYRLEIKNLIPNGDFTNTGAGALDAWVLTPGSVGTPKMAISSVTDITGSNPEDVFNPVTAGNNSLWVTLRSGTPSDSVDLRASDYAVDKDDLYLLRMNIRSYSTMNFSVGSNNYTLGGTEINGNDEDLTMSGLIAFPTSGNIPGAFNIPSAGTINFQLSPPTTRIMNLAIDDVEMVNATRDSYVSLKIPLLTDTKKPLIPGSLYLFTIAVRDELPAAISPLTPNVHRAKTLTLRLQYVDIGGYTRTTKVPISRPVSGWGVWERLTVDLSQFNTLNFPATYNPSTENPPVLTLSLSPTDSSNDQTKSSGRILISDPRFIFREK